MTHPSLVFSHATPVLPAGRAKETTRLPVGRILVETGALRARDLRRALKRQAHFAVPIGQILIREGLISELELMQALALQWAADIVDPVEAPADPRLIDLFGLDLCLAEGILPWRRVGGAIVILTSRPDAFDAFRGSLPRTVGPVLMALAPEDAITNGLRAVRHQALARRAETFSPADLSCRGSAISLLRLGLGGIAASLAAALWFAPGALALAVLGTALALMVAMMVLKLLAAALYLARPWGEVSGRHITRRVPVAHLPRVSILVPLHREREIARHLLKRLARLDYPRPLLEVCLVVEANDLLTREVLADTRLPAWMRVIVVPGGTLQTKPRALNYALDHCTGSIIGIYDAEDAPAGDQIHKVVRRFAAEPQDVACLQGVLDFYNREANALARCFAIDYNGWFRVMLPALERLGWVIPLGGTTVFFRRAALEQLGRWDAHNVTEDADLGVRLARFGFRTRMIESVTEEEANCRPWPWVRQRTRWLKGYIVTYAVHMRHPFRLLVDLGPWRFLGLQVLFGGTLLQMLLAPVLWSFWIGFAGYANPLVAALSHDTVLTIAGLLLLAEVATISFNLVALRKHPHRRLRPWVPLMHLYGMMASIAVYRALYEIVIRPYYWDKTDHGLFHQHGDGAAGHSAATSPASSLRRVS